jgi:hypothetical protein
MAETDRVLRGPPECILVVKEMEMEIKKERVENGLDLTYIWGERVGSWCKDTIIRLKVQGFLVFFSILLFFKEYH